MTTNLIEIQLMYVFRHYKLSLTRVKDTKGLPTSRFSTKFEIFIICLLLTEVDFKDRAEIFKREFDREFNFCAELCLFKQRPVLA